MTHTKDEALKLALEALEIIFASTHPYRDDGESTLTDKAVDLSNKAITAIKAALAQPAQEPVAWLTKNKFSDEIHFDEKNAKETTGWSAAFPVYTTPQPAQEPVAWKETDEVECPVCKDKGFPWPKCGHITYLEPTPPQRTWVGLTAEDILAVNMSTVTKIIDEPIVCDTDHNIIQLGKAIEAKLKKKNT